MMKDLCLCEAAIGSHSPESLEKRDSCSKDEATGLKYHFSCFAHIVVSLQTVTTG